MKSKIFIPALASLFLLIMVGYFIMNPSYEKSIKAKFYYETGEYKIALSLAQEAFNMDLYNRMAATIMAQSKASLKYVAYNEDAKKYMKDIDTIAKHEIISNADRAKIRTMCDIMINSYDKLAPSVVIDTKLLHEAKQYRDDFEKLFEKANR
ncbi:MAG: hypothetical protein U9N33_11905 [Campylobacterota bacterium]|nr:hypothetical protein [Campylobacterota bacterium]